MNSHWILQEKHFKMLTKIMTDMFLQCELLLEADSVKMTTTKTFAGISLPFCYSTTPARWTRSMITKSASPLIDTLSSHKIYHSQQQMSP